MKVLVSLVIDSTTYLPFTRNGTYQYAVGVKVGPKEKIFREWSRHRGTYQINPITELEAQNWDESNEYLRSLYTITFTPDPRTVQSIPDLKAHKLKSIFVNLWVYDILQVRPK